GEYDFIVKATADNGRTGLSSVRININGVNPNLILNAPSAGATFTQGQVVLVSGSHSGGISNIRFYYQRQESGPSGNVQMVGPKEAMTGTWVVPNQAGTYE